MCPQKKPWYTETRRSHIKEFFEMMLVNADNTKAIKGTLVELWQNYEKRMERKVPHP